MQSIQSVSKFNNLNVKLYFQVKKYHMFIVSWVCCQLRADEFKEEYLW